MKTIKCGTLDVALCQTNPVLARSEPERPDPNTEILDMLDHYDNMATWRWLVLMALVVVINFI